MNTHPKRCFPYPCGYNTRTLIKAMRMQLRLHNCYSLVCRRISSYSGPTFAQLLAILQDKTASNMQCCTVLVLMGALLVAHSRAQFQCEDDFESCFRFSSDAEKTPFSSLDTAELSGRCLTQCALEVIRILVSGNVYIILCSCYLYPYTQNHIQDLESNSTSVVLVSFKFLCMAIIRPSQYLRYLFYHSGHPFALVSVSNCACASLPASIPRLEPKN